MARLPLIRAEHRRSVVIAALMAVCFFCSLAVAHVYVRLHPRKPLLVAAERVDGAPPTYRTATEEELAPHGLTAAELLAQTGTTAMVRVDHTAGDPIYFMLSDGRGSVRMVVRLLLTVDTGDGPAPLPSPAELLRRRVSLQKGRPPRERELISLRINRSPGWQGDVSPVPGMAHYVWYIRLPRRRAVLVDVLAVEAAGLQVVPVVEPLINLIRRRVEMVDLAVPSVSDAIARGVELARRIKSDFGLNMSPGWTFQKFERDGSYLGYGVSVVSRGTGSDLPVRGRYLLRRGRTEMIYRWKASSDASAVQVERLRTVRVARGGTVEEILNYDMAANHLRLRRRVGGGSWQLVSEDAVAASYIPPIAEEYWPLGLLGRWQGQPAIVWFSRGLSLPEPYWVQFDEQRLALRIRPLMDLDTDELMLDGDGRVVTQTYLESDRPFEGRQTIRRTERNDLVRIDPALGPRLDKLEKDALHD